MKQFNEELEKVKIKAGKKAVAQKHGWASRDQRENKLCLEKKREKYTRHTH